MKVYWLSVKDSYNPKGMWDQYFLELFFKDLENLVVTELTFEDEAIVVLPTANQYKEIDKINVELNKIKKLTLIITSDEEIRLDLHLINHPNIKIFSQYPHKTDVDVTFIPIGFTPNIGDHSDIEKKDINVLFAGQIQNDDRRAMRDNLPDNAKTYISHGFAQGLNGEVYKDLMERTKIVPAPRGNIHPETFRLYEAICCGAMPIPQDRAFWEMIFDNAPFPILSKWEDLKGYIEDTLKDYPENVTHVQAYFARYLFDLKNKMFEEKNKYDTAIVIPVSPIPSHPSIDIFLDTYDSVRYHFPKNPIYITFDGVRAEQEHKRQDYYAHIMALLAFIRDDFNVYPVIYKNHMHQIGMMRNILPKIKSDTILYVEHDSPLVTDEYINWRACFDFLKSDSNMIRFHFESHIPLEHDYLMLEKNDIFMETAQWSQRPHLANTAFYNRILKYFSPNANCFIEDLLHGKLIEDFNNYGRKGWEQWRVHIYHPQGNIKRSYTLDGRAGSYKYDNTQKF